MALHAFHKSGCPEAKGNAGPLLNILATCVAIIAPLNAIPQIIKIFQTQSVGSVSLLTYLVVVATQIVWLIYGIKLSLKPLVISSIVVLLLSGTVLFQFFLYS